MGGSRCTQQLNHSTLLSMRLIYRFLIIVLIAGSWNYSLKAQGDLMNLFDEGSNQETDQTIATFKSTRILNGHSIERMQKKQLDVRIHHRFGTLNSGAYEFWGLDQANIHLGLEYGVTDWLMVGIGRGNYQKTVDGFLKFSLYRQSTGKKSFPVSISAFTSMAVEGMKHDDLPGTYYFSNRLSYCYQVLVARKFNDWLSLQLTPSFVHYNLVETELDPNNIGAIGLGGRVKLSKRVSFNAEYFYVIKPYSNRKNYDKTNSFSVGFDIETGGHVFQIVLTNSVAMIEKGFIGENTGKWGDGDIHLGFNLSRVFSFK